jgi:hypothetical protein
VVLVLTFALGMAVGRKGSPHREHDQTVAEPGRKPAAPAGRRSGLTDPVPERLPQEKLTFYQTLTAPMSAVPTPATVSVPAKPSRPSRAPRASACPAIGRWRPRRRALRSPTGSRARRSAPRGLAPGRRGPATGPCRSGFSRIAAKPRAFGVRSQPPASTRISSRCLLPMARRTTRCAWAASRPVRRQGQMAERVRQERSLTAFVTPK